MPDIDVRQKEKRGRKGNLGKGPKPIRDLKSELEKASIEFADRHLSNSIQLLHFLVDAVFLSRKKEPQPEDFKKLFRDDERLIKLILNPPPFDPSPNDDEFNIFARTWLGRAWCATKYAVSHAAREFWAGFKEGLGLKGPK